MRTLVDRLVAQQQLTDEELRQLLLCQDVGVNRYLRQQAQAVRQRVYGRDVYIRGLIEFTNYCRNNCYYCGIRAGNSFAQRYRLSNADILTCCQQGYQLGFRTFVLQGGEDPYFTDARMLEIISAIKSAYPDCALTLSIGERSFASYKAFFDAGADRYLLRHETACPAHYARLHPPQLQLSARKQCLYDLKRIGFQVGCGFMVGSPYQTIDTLIMDLRFIKEFQPHMVGLGPFIPHQNTPFRDFPAGSISLSLKLLCIIRLLLPHVLLPATTALGTLDKQGREEGILSGANVIMPNLSPAQVRGKYLLYDNKAFTGDEAAEGLQHIQQQLNNIGYHVVIDRGDCIGA